MKQIENLIPGSDLPLPLLLYHAEVAVTHDPNRKEDRPTLKRGEYMAGASIAWDPRLAKGMKVLKQSEQILRALLARRRLCQDLGSAYEL